MTTPRRRWQDAVSRLSIYLPIMLMGLLALASYWLLRITPEPPAPEPERAVTEHPDFYIRGFAIKAFDERGRLKSEVRGIEGRHYPYNETLVIDKARIMSISEKGLVSSATANQITSNDETTDFLLEGDAVVVRQAGRDDKGRLVPRVEFHGPVLRVLTEPQERIMSDQPVLLIRGNDQITADSLDYTGDESRVADLEGRVNATFAPRP